MLIQEQKSLRFIRKVPCKVHFPTLEMAIFWYNRIQNNSKPLFWRKTIFGRGGRDNCSYPAVSIHNEKIMIHVLLMMYRLRGNIPEDKIVHHENEDKSDARRDNLSLMDISEHARLHNFGKDCARWRGRKLNYADSDAVALVVRTESVVASEPKQEPVPF